MVGSEAPARSHIGRIAGFGWYAILLTLSWLLEVYAVSRVEPPAALRAFLVAIAVSLVVTLVLTVALGRERGALAAATVLVALIAGHNPLIVLVVPAAIVILLIERHWSGQGRLRLPWPRIHETLTILIAILFVIQLGRVASMADPPSAVSPSGWAGQTLSDGPRPDIFILVADAHGRQDILREGYGYDDAPFIDALQAMGFEVLSSSRSNYTYTEYSLASMFSASYLPGLNDHPDKEFQDALARRTVHDNPLFPLLRRAGYAVAVISSGYEHLGLRSADQYVDTGQPNEFEFALMANIAATGIWDAIDPQHDLDAIRQRTRDEITSLVVRAANGASTPRFIFTHLPVPHWPFVFDADCGAATRTGQIEGGEARHAGTAITVAATVSQTICVDRLVTDAVAQLVSMDPDAVVIVMSDHGPEEHLDWWVPDAAGVNERTANLMAIRTPGRASVLPQDLTLVNLMPTLLNAYLGTSLPIQPNEFWFGPSPQDRQFVQVHP